MCRKGKILKKSFKKNQIIITGLAIMIAIAGYINYTGNLRDIINVGNSAKSYTDPTSNPIDASSNDILSNDAEPDEESIIEPGTAILTSSNNVSGIVSEAKLSREQVRAKNKETLLEIVNNVNLTGEAKANAVKQVAELTENSEKEMAAELLLEAKGFTDVVVSVVNNTVDVVINKTSLTDSERVQIEDIVKRKTNMTADKITINVCNN